MMERSSRTRRTKIWMNSSANCVSKLQQKVLRNKLRKSLDERPAAPAAGLAGEGLLGVAKD